MYTCLPSRQLACACQHVRKQTPSTPPFCEAGLSANETLPRHMTLNTNVPASECVRGKVDYSCVHDRCASSARQDGGERAACSRRLGVA